MNASTAMYANPNAPTMPSRKAKKSTKSTPTYAPNASDTTMNPNANKSAP